MKSKREKPLVLTARCDVSREASCPPDNPQQPNHLPHLRVIFLPYLAGRLVWCWSLRRHTISAVRLRTGTLGRGSCKAGDLSWSMAVLYRRRR